MARVRIQVIKVYDIEVDDSVQDPIQHVENMGALEIQCKGDFVEVSTEFAELV